MTIDNRITALIKLGNFLQQFEQGQQQEHIKGLNEQFYSSFNDLIQSIYLKNPWFTEQNVRRSIGAISKFLQENTLVDFTSFYIHEFDKQKAPKTVAVIMAGNIPLVAFHDWLCVLLSGNKFLGKPSSEDNLLLPFISSVLIAIEPHFNTLIEFTDGQLKKMDAVIATGSNNSALYFDYYFGKYPNIIRKNRNSVAVLDGTETPQELNLLGVDIFQYYGLGCRNVSKIFVPENYQFNAFFESIIDFKEVVNHNKYANNYEYNRTVYLMGSNKSLLDNNFLLLKEDSSYTSPIGVLFYEYYSDIEELIRKLDSEKEGIQCIVSKNKTIKNSIHFGSTQFPSLTDYADGVDTMRFLMEL